MKMRNQLKENRNRYRNWKSEKKFSIFHFPNRFPISFNRYHTKKAFTLVEILTVVFLGTLIIMAAYEVYLMSYKSYKRNSQSAELTQNARIAMERFSRDIRQAEEIVTVLPADPSAGAPPSEIKFQDGHTIYATPTPTPSPPPPPLPAPPSPSDTEPPSGTISLNPNSSDYSNYLPITTVTVSASDSGGSGLLAMELSIDDMTFASSTGWITYEPSIPDWNMTNANYGGNSNPGQKILYIRFKDNAGNISLTSSASYTYNLAPEAYHYFKDEFLSALFGINLAFGQSPNPSVIQYITYYLSGTDLHRKISHYYCSDNASQYVDYATVCISPNTLEQQTDLDQIKAQKITNLQFWGTDTITVHLTVGDETTSYQFETKATARNI